MYRLLEKSAILIICILALAVPGGVSAAPVAALLSAFAVSAIAQLFSGKPAAWIIIAVFCGASCFFPIMFCAVPLLFYDALCENKWWLVTPAVLVVYDIGQLNSVQYIVVFAGMVTAFIMYLRISSLEKSVGNLKNLRDEITEKNMQLANQNIRLAEAQDSEVHIAMLKERNRIAREIHDNVGHMLTRSILQTGALQIMNKDEKLKEPIAELKNTLDGAMTSIRSSVHDLHDDSIDLKKTIEEMTVPIKNRFDVMLRFDAGEHIPGEIKLCAAGIVKESISNVVKHSDGNRIEIVFCEHPAFWQLLVEDNGKKKNTAEKNRGIGLKNMEDRAAGVGGRITFTQSESGFRVFMTIPKER